MQCHNENVPFQAMMTPDKDSSEHLLTNGTNHDQPRKDKVSIAEPNPWGEFFSDLLLNVEKI